jgi:hypothetical protein
MQERRKIEYRRATYKKRMRFAVKFFCPTSHSNQESEGFFCPRATYKGKYGKAKEAIESTRAGLSPQKGDLRKSRKRREKKKTKEGEKVAPAKARFRVPYTKNSFFWFMSIWA